MNPRPVGTLEFDYQPEIQASLRDAPLIRPHPAMNRRANINRPYRDEKAVKLKSQSVIA